MSEKGRVFSGPRARFSINGIKVGYATNVEIGESIEYTPLEVLDNIRIEEFVPVAYRINFRCGTVKIVGESLKALGMFPNTGGSSDEHLSNVLMAGDLTATIEDTKTGKLIATVTGVKVASHNYRISARAIVGEDVDFIGIKISDESEI